MTPTERKAALDAINWMQSLQGPKDARLEDQSKVQMVIDIALNSLTAPQPEVVTVDDLWQWFEDGGDIYKLRNKFPNGLKITLGS